MMAEITSNGRRMCVVWGRKTLGPGAKEMMPSGA